MSRYFLLFFLPLLISCAEEKKMPTAQEIVDKSIEFSGGSLHDQNRVSFKFRDKIYSAHRENLKKVYTRKTVLDTIPIIDVMTGNAGFQRFINDSLVHLSDSVAQRYQNSINSVHYFARLPFGLNDPAVEKELLGERTVKGRTYYWVKVTFDEKNGGDDFEDTYLYWFDKETFKLTYLSYEFHVNGGGIRFREAYNERFVNGIRFVDYNNFKADPSKISFIEVADFFEDGKLELLSKIELEEIVVQPTHL